MRERVSSAWMHGWIVSDGKRSCTYHFLRLIFFVDDFMLCCYLDRRFSYVVVNECNDVQFS